MDEGHRHGRDERGQVTFLNPGHAQDVEEVLDGRRRHGHPVPFDEVDDRGRVPPFEQDRRAPQHERYEDAQVLPRDPEDRDETQ